jgi:hypothetical protein
MKNDSAGDWLQDAGLGFAGGLFCLFVAMVTPGVELLAIFFGYAGRIILINIGKKAEDASTQIK